MHELKDEVYIGEAQIKIITQHKEMKIFTDMIESNNTQ
jgi:hypothetical protein